MAVCPLRMLSLGQMLVHQRDPVRLASPMCRSHVDPSVPRSHVGTMPPLYERNANYDTDET